MRNRWPTGGPIWDFRNASARDYYVEHVIGEVANESDAINLVFFDGGLGFLAENPHPSPSGKIGGSNCSIAYVHNSSSPGGRDMNLTDADRLESVHASLAVLKRVAEALNAKNMVPMFSLAVPFDPVKAKHRGYPGEESTGHVFTESAVVKALENVTWMRCVSTVLPLSFPMSSHCCRWVQLCGWPNCTLPNLCVCVLAARTWYPTLPCTCSLQDHPNCVCIHHLRARMLRAQLRCLSLPCYPPTHPSPPANSFRDALSLHTLACLNTKYQVLRVVPKQWVV